MSASESDGLKKGSKGGVFQKSTWLLGGVIQKSTSVHKGGGGGQKRPKIGPHGLRMPPNGYLFSLIVLHKQVGIKVPSVDS